MPKAAKAKKAVSTTSAVNTTQSAHTTTKASEKIEWPTFNPILPVDSLEISTILPHQIVTIPQFFTANLCKTFVTFLSKLPLVTTPKQPKKGEAVRVNDRFQTQDPEFAKNLWLETGLKEILEREESRNVLWKDDEIQGGVKAWGLNPNIRIYRYTPGQHFAKHFDDANTMVIGTPPLSRRTIYTLLIYLTGPGDGLVGGETAFYPQEPYVPLTKRQAKERSETLPQIIKVDPERGMALLHRHGDECLLHEGMAVKEGVKWIIRSDVVVDN